VIGFPFLLVISLAAIWNLPTNQELLANYAKSQDYWEAMRSVGGWPWWTPNYLGGTSLAPAWGFMVVNLWLLLWTSLLGMSAGSQIALFLCLPLAAATSYFFIRAWTKSEFVAGVGAILYILSPSLWMRIVAVEHLVVVAALAVLPLTFLGMLRMIRSPNGWSASLAGAGLALLALTYSKAAILALPFVAVFWLVLTIQNKSFGLQWKSPVRTGFLASSFFLGVVPLLPSVRESSFLIFFEHGPFAGWQNAFCLKSPMQLLDRLGELSAGYSMGFAPTTAAGGFYLGSVTLAVLLLAWVLWYWKPTSLVACDFLKEGKLRSPARLAGVLILLGIWLAAGPNNVISAHFVALEASVKGMDFTVVFLWGLLIVTAWLVWILSPGKGLKHQLIGGLLLAVFLFIPGFRLLEFLPFFDNIRAPFDFYQLPVPLFVATVGGILAVMVWQSGWNVVTRISLLTLACVLVAWDTSGFFRLQKGNQLTTGTWESFEKTQDFLRKSPTPGAVLPVSGRYFYLLTPQLSGRPLLMEAFQSYLQQRDFAWLLAQTQAREEFHEIGLRISGTSHILWDSEAGTAEKEPSILSVTEPVYRDADFGVFAVSDPLFPAFVAKSALQVEQWDFRSYETSLIAGRLGFVPLEGFELEEGAAGLGGFLRGDSLDLSETAQRDGGAAWQKMDSADWDRDNYQKMRVRFSDDAVGWLILTQAWHPDWQAVTAEGKELVVGRAFGALPAIAVLPGEEILFRFEPPFWYSLAASTTVASWLIFFVVGLVRIGSQKIHLSQRGGITPFFKFLPAKFLDTGSSQ
jgi:hypothetical protein